MQIEINKHQKIKSICRVLNNYPLAFENKPQALAMKEALGEQSDDLSNLISKLLRPASTIHRPKQDSQQKLTASVIEYIGMGILLATHLDNKPLLDILRVYKSRILSVSAYRLYEIAVHVAAELAANSELAGDYGLTAVKLEAFNTQVTDFGETIGNTSDLLTDRKSGWNELNKKLVQCSKTIRLKLDPFMEFNEKEFPDLFRDYMLVRGKRKRKKRVIKDSSTTGEFSGTVTDSKTGFPVANATINLMEQEAVFTTDADGYYLIEELEPGTYTLSCHAVGYNVPEQVNYLLVAGESLIVDFNLVSSNPLNN